MVTDSIDESSRAGNEGHRCLPTKAGRSEQWCHAEPSRGDLAMGKWLRHILPFLRPSPKQDKPRCGGGLRGFASIHDGADVHTIPVHLTRSGATMSYHVRHLLPSRAQGLCRTERNNRSSYLGSRKAAKRVVVVVQSVARP